ncbi:hypothetical protein BUY81_12915 [Staphylococcus equorum]|uniref:hypothetical protein n=1 Tax=Staphylococcus equorum TaxID=246432 RepID=UPI000D1C80DD|nr:hypothetical protein [Staphylococcus equorum]PTF09918.1 hypothetical protein BUY81_12915 [Staphylococcus equorum]
MTLFYRIIVIALSIITIISILLSKAQIPQNLIALPLLFICLFLFLPMFSKFMFTNIGITIVNVTMLIRYVISPFLMSIYGVNLSTGMSTSIAAQSKAVNLMLFEMAAVIVTFCLFHKRFYSYTDKFKTIKAKPNLFGWMFVTISILILLFNPEILGRYTFIWTASELKSKNAVESVSVFFLIIQLAQVVFTIGLINWIYKFYEQRKSVIYLILSFLVVGISSSFITGTSRFSIILPLATGLFTIFILYKNYRKLIMVISVIMSSVLILVSTLLKQNTIASQTAGASSASGSIFESLNSDLQLYFSGVANVTHAINTSHVYPPFQFDAILSELFRSVVFLSSLFGNHQSALSEFNGTFYNRSLVSDQILPMVGQGFLYFGPYLAPLFSVISILIVMLLDKKIFNADSVFKVYIMAYLCIKFALFYMANATIQISFFTNFFIILLVISYCNKKLILKRG